MATAVAVLSYCGQQVRKYDNDRFLSCLFAPADRREALFALHAFNLEIAKTREVVSEPMLGQIRLQWWRDSIAGVYGAAGSEEIRRHEVLQPVAEAVTRHALTRGHFERLIDAREADLEDELPASLDCLRNYADVTATPLVHLNLEALGVRDAAAAEAGRHVAIAWSLTGLLRAVPFHARQHRLYLPADRLAHHGLCRQTLFDLKPGPGLPALVREVAALARDHLAQARALHRAVPRAALPALLPAALAQTHLDTLDKAGYDVFSPRVLMPSPYRQLRLGWQAMRGRY